MDQIVDQIKLVAVEGIDEGKARPVAVAETDDSSGLERNDPGREQGQELGPLRPSFLYDMQRFSAERVNDFETLALGV